MGSASLTLFPWLSNEIQYLLIHPYRGFSVAFLAPLSPNFLREQFGDEVETFTYR